MPTICHIPFFITQVHTIFVSICLHTYMLFIWKCYDMTKGRCKFNNKRIYGMQYMAGSQCQQKQWNIYETASFSQAIWVRHVKLVYKNRAGFTKYDISPEICIWYCCALFCCGYKSDTFTSIRNIHQYSPTLRKLYDYPATPANMGKNDNGLIINQSGIKSQQSRNNVYTSWDILYAGVFILLSLVARF